MFKLKNKKHRAFTLVEILVVILIIGLLFVFLVPKISSATDKARETGVKTDFHSYEVAMESLMKEQAGLGGNQFTDIGDFAEKLNEYLDPELQFTGSGTTYTSNKKDPWNNAYKLLLSGTASSNNGAAQVYTTGKDSDGTNEIKSVQVDRADLGQENNGDNLSITCAFVDGVEYTTSLGFSTNISALGGVSNSIGGGAGGDDGSAGGDAGARIEYTILDGENLVFPKQANDSFVVCSDAPYSDFESVKVDGSTVDPSNYTLSGEFDGLTWINFTVEYSNGLDVGSHTVEIVSSNGSAVAEFSVTEGSNSGFGTIIDLGGGTGPQYPIELH